MRIRSLAIKLTAAFVLVGIASIVLVTIFVGWQTRREFDRFVIDRFGADLAGDLGVFYARADSWQGVDVLMRREFGPGTPRPAPVVIVDANGGLLFGRPWSEKLPDPSRASNSIPIHSGGLDNAETVGYVIFDLPTFGSVPANSPEQRFVERVRTAALWGAAGAMGLALLLGFLLARSLTRPLRALTTATRALAQGQWGQQVQVKSRDELGELGLAFNQMSSDLERNLRLRRQMTADIAHDLRTPLSVILGYAEALDEGKFQPTPEVFSILHDEALHLNHLIDDLRLLSLADAGELVLRTTLVDPAEMLAHAAAAHRLAAEQRGVTIVVDAPPGLPAVAVDSERLAQVMGNLIGNAIRHTPSGGTITLRAHQGNGVAPEMVALDVADTGEGIAADELDSIFDRFYRGDKARRQTGESGLGLAIARSVVEAHGGTITVQSTPEKGATFTVNLPVGGN